MLGATVLWVVLVVTSRAGTAAGGAAFVLLAGCGSTLPAPSVVAMDKGYLAIAIPANRVLETSFDALEYDRSPTKAARELRRIAATERSFDRALLALKLPAPMASTVVQLVRVNEARASLTTRAAGAHNPWSLDRYKAQLKAANASVEAQVRTLRRDLRLPPPDAG